MKNNEFSLSPLLVILALNSRFSIVFPSLSLFLSLLSFSLPPLSQLSLVFSSPTSIHRIKTGIF